MCYVCVLYCLKKFSICILSWHYFLCVYIYVYVCMCICIKACFYILVCSLFSANRVTVSVLSTWYFIVWNYGTFYIFHFQWFFSKYRRGACLEACEMVDFYNSSNIENYYNLFLRNILKTGTLPPEGLVRIQKIDSGYNFFSEVTLLYAWNFPLVGGQKRERFMHYPFWERVICVQELWKWASGFVKRKPIIWLLSWIENEIHSFPYIKLNKNGRLGS